MMYLLAIFSVRICTTLPHLLDFGRFGDNNFFTHTPNGSGLVRTYVWRGFRGNWKEESFSLKFSTLLLKVLTTFLAAADNRTPRHYYLPLPIYFPNMSKTLLEWTSSRGEKRQFGKSFRISCSIQATKVKHPDLNAANRYIMHARALTCSLTLPSLL